jgi:hypothetical protein
MLGNEADVERRGSTTLLLLAPLVVLSTLGMSGPVKVITGWSSPLSLTASIALVGALLVTVFRLERPYSPRSLRMLMSLGCGAALLGALCVRLLYNPHVFGMVNFASQPDAGTHVFYSVHYGANKGGEIPYSGFVGFHLAAYWLATILHLTPFSDFRLLFYLTVLAWPLSLAALAGLIIPQRASAVVIAIGLTLFAAPIASDIVIPIFHGMQSLASYPQLFGLIPLFLCWAGYAGCHSPLARLLCVGISVFLLRYTYGLNVGDLVATLALLSLVEATELNGTIRRVLAVLIAIGLGLVAYKVYAQLWLIRAQQGPRPTVDLVPMSSVIAQLIGTIALLSMPAFLDIKTAPVAKRIFRFAGLFGASTAFVQLVYLNHGIEPQYYFAKYQLYGPVIVGSGLVLAAIAALLQSGAADMPRWRGPVALAFTVLSSVFVLRYNNEGIHYYRASAQSLAYAPPPYSSFLPLCDLDAARIVSQVLRQQNGKFGAYFAIPLGYMFFMDQQFGGAGMHWSQYYHDPNFVPGKRSLSAPGYCFFWDHPGSVYRRWLPWAAEIEQLEQRPNRRCFLYSPRYEPQGTIYRLCSVCN